MLSKDTFEHQVGLLNIYRRNLGQLLDQAARHSVLNVPVHIQNSIDDARENIARIKNTIRTGGWSVTDEPDDTAAPALPPVPDQASSGALLRVTIDVRVEDMATVSKFAVKIHQVESI